MAWAVFTTKSKPSLRLRAMRLLARREHSRAELHRKLAAHAGADEPIDALLDDLDARGWLSDARFAELTLRAKARRFGPLKVAHYLKDRGVSEANIAAGARAAGLEGAADIEAIWRSRFRAPPADEREKLRHVRFLQGRGFPVDKVFRFLKQLESRP